MASAGWVDAFFLEPRKEKGRKKSELNFVRALGKKNLSDKGEEVEETSEAREKLIIAKTRPQFGNEIGGGARSKWSDSAGWIKAQDGPRFLMLRSNCTITRFVP